MLVGYIRKARKGLTLDKIFKVLMSHGVVGVVFYRSVQVHRVSCKV